MNGFQIHHYVGLISVNMPVWQCFSWTTKYVLAKSWNTRMVPLCSKPGVLWCSPSKPSLSGGKHPALSCALFSPRVLSCELEKKSKASQLCGVQDMRHISNVESGNSKEIAKKRTSDNRSGNPFKMGCPVRTPRNVSALETDRTCSLFYGIKGVLRLLSHQWI